MKRQKTITLETWLIEEIMRKHPQARTNFSRVAEALLMSAVNNPLQYWRAKAKLHQQLFQSAMLHVDTLRSMIKDTPSQDQKQEVLV